jgi:hypothetical protein
MLTPPPSPPSLPPSLPPSSPDGDEEVLEIAVDVEELMSFANNLEDALKGVARKDQTAPPPAVILNATNLHWLLGQVGEGGRAGGRQGGREVLNKGFAVSRPESLNCIQ